MIRAKAAATSQSVRIQIEAFVDSAEARQAAERLVAQSGEGVGVTFHAGTLSAAARLTGAAPLGDLLIAEAGASFESDLERIAELSAAGARVIVLGHRDDVATFRAVMAAGACDYFALPVTDDDDLMLGMVEPPAAPEAAQAMRMIAVCGVSGGVGASALAQNLALAYVDAGRSAQLARDPEGRVALLDADLEFGSAAVDLDVEQTPGLFDALQVPERVDKTFLVSTMGEPIDGLWLYSAGVSEAAQIPQLQDGVSRLLRRLCKVFPTLVVDLPRALLAAQPELAEEFDEIVFVLGPGFSSVRNCSRLIERIGTHSGGPRVSLVLSHTRRGAGLRRAEITQALGMSSLHELPESASDLARAAVKGQPLQRLARKGAYGRAVSRLLAHIESPRDAQQGRPRGKGLFGRMGLRP